MIFIYIEIYNQLNGKFVARCISFNVLNGVCKAALHTIMRNPLVTRAVYTDILYHIAARFAIINYAINM